ncbi:YbjP/YqhG family protein [Massilia oculi]|uniref:YbjP/YqhG family protein n=1 Tax=Massilia oculi TaxID=945844 RepID=UPI001E55A0CD|nr:YbjP/YqhG family protein [Massilia oculi]
MIKDRQCAAKAGGICNLDFDPIFASQDPAAVDLSIRSMPNDIVAVEFTYPAHGERVKLEYRLAKNEGAWRIGDIRYPGMSDTSLKQLLARKLPDSGK